MTSSLTDDLRRRIAAPEVRGRLEVAINSFGQPVSVYVDDTQMPLHGKRFEVPGHDGQVLEGRTTWQGVRIGEYRYSVFNDTFSERAMALLPLLLVVGGLVGIGVALLGVAVNVRIRASDRPLKTLLYAGTFIISILLWLSLISIVLPLVS